MLKNVANVPFSDHCPVLIFSTTFLFPSLSALCHFPFSFPSLKVILFFPFPFLSRFALTSLSFLAVSCKDYRYDLDPSLFHLTSVETYIPLFGWVRYEEEVMIFFLLCQRKVWKPKQLCLHSPEIFSYNDPCFSLKGMVDKLLWYFTLE